LPVEQLQYLALQAAVAESHARELAAVDGGSRRGRRLIDDLAGELRHETSRGLYGPFCCRAV
jgi:hypothetical protein